MKKIIWRLFFVITGNAINTPAALVCRPNLLPQCSVVLSFRAALPSFSFQQKGCQAPPCCAKCNEAEEVAGTLSGEHAPGASLQNPKLSQDPRASVSPHLLKAIKIYL